MSNKENIKTTKSNKINRSKKKHDKIEKTKSALQKHAHKQSLQTRKNTERHTQFQTRANKKQREQIIAQYRTGVRFPTIVNKSLNYNANHPREILTAWTPTQVKEYIWGDKLEGAIRTVIEPIGADSQCNRAGLKFNAKTTTCWLCGCIIGNENKACEHILPALRAVMLTGMITTQEITNRQDFKDANTQLLQSITTENYLWAHDNCNGSSGKSGLVLLKLNSSGLFDVDLKNCDELYKKILLLRHNKDCYQRGADRRYTNIFDRLQKEMKEKCAQINSEVEVFYRMNTDINKAINTYIEYTLNIIKLYANSSALELLLSPEEMQKINTENLKKLEELKLEQEKLKKISEDKYRDFLELLIKYNKTKSVYNQVGDVPIFEMVRINCSDILSIKNLYGEIIDIPITIQSITNNIVDVLKKLLTEFFIFFKKKIQQNFVPIELVVAIIDYVTIALTYIEDLKYNTIQPYMNIKKTKINERNINKYLCKYFFIFISKLYDETINIIDFYESYKEHYLYKNLIKLFNKYNITIVDCDVYIEKNKNLLKKNLEKEIKPNAEYTEEELQKMYKGLSSFNSHNSRGSRIKTTSINAARAAAASSAFSPDASAVTVTSK
jgi:hypothetical protein